MPGILGKSTSTGTLDNRKAFRLPRQNANAYPPKLPPSPEGKPPRHPEAAWDSDAPRRAKDLPGKASRPETPSILSASSYSGRDSSPGRSAEAGTLPTILPIPGAISPYDENQRLRRELAALKKRYRGLELELKRPMANRTRTLQAVYVGLADEEEEEGPAEAGAPARDWEAEMGALREGYDRRLAALAAERDDAADAMATLRATLEAQLAARSKDDKEARVELLRKQSMRRLMNKGLVRGWLAWSALYKARSYAINRLRQVASHLRSPSKCGAPPRDRPRRASAPLLPYPLPGPPTVAPLASVAPGRRMAAAPGRRPRPSPARAKDHRGG
jgi:hypothetical protein